jgi:glycosyltransferase involved in cell wall biosynthesis
LEVIVADDSTNDEPQQVVEDYIAQYPNRHITYHKNPSTLGMVGNRNKLLALKKGEYFIFVSDDDKFYDEKSLRSLYD